MIIPLNIVNLDGGKVIIKSGNLQDKEVEITENGTIEVAPDSGFSGLEKVTINTEVKGGSASKWTGHADAEGLRAIGWTDEDIQYYQENGVNWNEEDDEYHKVSDDNKALYGVLTADNISTYKDRIVYLPKIDTSGVTSMYQKFSHCYSLVAIPMLDTSNVINMNGMFQYCYSLKIIPQLNTQKVTEMQNMFRYCFSLKIIPQLNTSNVTNMSNMFERCCALICIPFLDTLKVTHMNSIFSMCSLLESVPNLNTANVEHLSSGFYGCYSLVTIPQFNVQKITSLGAVFTDCYSLTYANLHNVKATCYLSSSQHLSKASLLYIINNEAATSAITIKLASYAYTRLAEDADILAALANHPNISIAQ